MPRLAEVVDLLRKHYGRPRPPITTDPFELLLLEKRAILFRMKNVSARFWS